ncbi:MAG: transcription termination factor NusA [Chloroflexota bacterium]
MKSDFLLAITQLSAEKNLSREVVLSAVEAALASAYRKDSFAANQNITVKINPNTGKVEVWAEKTVVDKVQEAQREISLKEARRLKPDINLDETILIETTPRNAGRIAAQTAKQVILQRLHEAEHSAILEEYTERESSIVTGIVQRIEANKQIFIDLGRTEALMPASEQVHNERYRIGQRLKVYLVEVARTNRGPRVVVSRSHPSLLRRLFELEIPEVYSGIVEIKSVAREAGYRSKVAVAARQEGIDPVGCCVGLRGIRIQNIVTALSGEKIDVVKWDPSPAIFIANALSPAQVLSVSLNEAAKVAKVVIPDKQLSLAIGKEGQNVRLAVKLTDWRIDIKSASQADAEKLAALKETEEAAMASEALAKEEEEAAPEVPVAEEKEIPLPVAEETVIAREPEEGEIAEKVVEVTTEEELPVIQEPVLVSSKAEEVVIQPPLPAQEPEVIEEIPFEPRMAPPVKGQIRFAEDIMAPRPPKPGAKSKKMKKKGSRSRSAAGDDFRAKPPRRGQGNHGGTEDYS